MLRTRDLRVGYAGVQVLGPLDLQLAAGRLVCLLGANGAGKSTLIRTLCGMQSALGGTVELDGTALYQLSPGERARRLAVVLTDRVDAGMLSGFELAALGRYPHLGWSGRLQADDRRLVLEALKAAGALDLAARAVAQMSDGERQRVMLARALAQQPRVLVLDEITAFLDLPRRIEVMRLLQRLAREQNLAILLSCHDLELALRCADRIWLVDAQRRLHEGAPEDLVLDGSLNHAFASAGLHFDVERGEWAVAASADERPIRLLGEGVARTWTRRALERVGYREASSARRAVVVGEDGFRLLEPGETRHFARLGELVEALEAAEPRP